MRNGSVRCQSRPSTHHRQRLEQWDCSTTLVTEGSAATGDRADGVWTPGLEHGDAVGVHCTQEAA